MATTATPPVPAAPAAAPAAAAATPVIQPVSPAQQQPAVQPASVAQPAVPTAPKASDFANTRDGQMEYLTKRKAFEAEQAKTAAKPAEGIAQPAVQAAPTEADKAAAAQLGQQPGEAAKPAEGAAQPAAAEGETVTPKGLADLMQKTPELGAFLEQHPEVKGPLFATARRLAAIEPIAALFPTVGDAQFAQRQASDMVGLKTASLRAVEAPETIPELLSAFDGQFAVVDKDGKPVLDAQGNPSYESDHRVFQDALIGRRLSQQNAALAPQIEQLKGKLASGVYPHAAAKAMDQKRLETLEFAATALEVVENVLTGDWFQEEAPAIPANAPEEFKVWAEQERQRLADERKKLDEQQQGKTTEERKQAKTQFETAVRFSRRYPCRARSQPTRQRAP